MYSLRMSFWIVPCSLSMGDALPLGRRDVEAEQHRGRAVDRHRGGDLVERDPVEQRLHVGQAGDGDAALAHLALGAGMVGVVAHQGGKVEGDREAGLAPLQQELVALVGVLGGAEAGELPHGPEPAPVHRGVDAAGVGELAREGRWRRPRRARGRAGCRPARPSAGDRGEVASSRTGSAAALARHAATSARSCSSSRSCSESRSGVGVPVGTPSRHMRAPCFRPSSTSAATS